MALMLQWSVGAVGAAATETSVWQVDVSVPVINRAILGTLTANVDPATGNGDWSFQGTVDGHTATASGKGQLSGSGSNGTITITSIDQWNLPGVPKPGLPLSGSVKVTGNVAYLTIHAQTLTFPLIPLSISGSNSSSVQFPPAAGTYAVTMAGSGTQDVNSLPVTGAGPVGIVSGSRANWALALELAGMLLVMALAVVAVRQRWPQHRAS
jgi:hypothetical protein